MPTISSFYGITIVMFQKDKEHNPPQELEEMWESGKFKELPPIE